MPNDTRVLYNAACPVCRAEIDHYARYTGARSIIVHYDDLNSQARADWGIDADTAARRLHVMQNGQLYTGVDAFLILWRQMPRYRPLAALVGLPGVRQLAGWMYDHVLAPRLYRRHLRRSTG
jgi:predicted DCC family thiol-disulfide oxidoreductase YuxK